ncbi:MAG: hypothetical protein U0414_08630 [Polyangiaceae bacterium]
MADDGRLIVCGSDDESWHLLHIGATRAAHQLWILTTSSAGNRLDRSRGRGRLDVRATSAT